MSRHPLIPVLGILAVVVSALAVFFALRSPQDAEIVVQLDWAVDDSCPDALLIGAAGSGQRDDILGVGPQVESVVLAFSSRLTEQSPVSIYAGFMALDYPAPGVIEGSLQGLTGDGMFASIAEGGETLAALVATISARCPDSIIYLIGYSQGAAVIHATIVDLPPEYSDSIGGAVVLADPFRDADDPNARNFTTELDSDAVEHTRDGSFAGLPLPDWVQGSFYSACARRDTVCNFSLRDLLVTDSVHTDETYNDLGPQIGRLLADDLLDSM